MKILKLDLNKSAEALRLSLAKVGVATPPKADLAFDLDVSGSFDDEHKGGLTQALLERLVPWGMVFDPDQKLDVFTFSSGESGAHYVGEITPETCEGYIRNNIIECVPGYNGGTDYSYVLEKNLQHFGWIQSSTSPAPAPKKGLFGGLFGGKSKATATADAPTPVEKKRSIVMFVTDGSNSDKQRTHQILQDSASRGDEIYFLFIGCSNQGASTFKFINDLGDEFPNVGFVAITDIAAFTAQSDEEINGVLIGEELVNWLKK